jgi:hypothetical protein
MILEMCISSVQQRNRCVLPLNRENEVCVKEEYTITYIYWVHKTMCIEEYGVFSEIQVITDDILARLFHKFFWKMDSHLYNMGLQWLHESKLIRFCKWIFHVTDNRE